MTFTSKPFQLLLAGASVIAALAVGLHAQGLTVGIASRLAAGPDYATDVLGDPWNMCNPQDISVYPDELSGWAGDFTFFPATGTRPCIVGGTTSTNDTNLPLLYRGFENINNPGRTGLRSPIDTNLYKKVAFKMYSGATSEFQIPQVYWFHRPYNLVDTALGGLFVGATGIGANPNVDSTKIYVGDLTQPRSDGTQDWTNTTSGPVRGFRIDPNISQSGQPVFFYWARLTRADNDPLAVRTPVSWTGASGSTSIDVLDAGSGPDNAILNIGSGLPASGTIDWKYGVLPPGNYTLRITSGAGIQNRAFTINTPPSLRITDPDETGGEDFATAVRSDPWDMNNVADVPFTVHLSSSSFHDGLFDGTSDGQEVFANGGDPALFVLASTNNQTAIASQRYRFLTFRMQLDAPFNLFLGSVARVFWGPDQNNPSNLTTTKDIIIWPGMNSYTIDLGSLTAATGGGIEPGGASTQTWTAAPIRQFRIDPDEFIAATRFLFDDVKVAAMDEATNGHFVIKFAGSDPDVSDVPRVSLYYNATPAVAGRTLIASNVLVSAGQYDWNTSSVTPGTYYISADVTDGIDARTYYSSGQLLVPGPTPPATGDEVAIDYGGSGLYVLYNSGPAFTQLHGTNPGPMTTADIDGNGLKDLIVDFPGAGIWVWSNNSSWFKLHPASPRSMVSGDLDGNGLDEVLIDFPGAGIWVWRNNTSWSQLHTTNPSRMVIGDLDGNGRADAVIDFPGAGIWIWSNNSSWGQLHTLNGASMAIGDLDGGGRADILIGFTGAGLWVRYNNSFWVQLHGTTPPRMTTGDLDGNGQREAIIDFTGYGLWVWRNNSGWSQLHTSDAAGLGTADIDGSGRSDVIIDFGGLGLWAWKNDAAFIQLHAQSPEALAAGNLDGQ